MKLKIKVLALSLCLAGCTERQVNVPSSTDYDKEIIEESLPPDHEAISQTGPYGTVSLYIPDTWTYRLCAMDDKNLITADYGIQIHPIDQEGCIEIGCTSTFGVCGTCLQEEEVIFANQKAMKGTYDNNEYWSFIAFNDIPVVALGSFIDSWTEEDMDTALSILDTLSFDPSIASGAICHYERESEDPDIGLEVSLSGITPESAVIVFYQYDPSVSAELTFGMDFFIQKQNGETYESLESAENTITAMAYGITPDDKTEYFYDWHNVYGTLQEGEYRIGIHVAEEKQDGTYADHILYAYFLLK